MLCRHKAVFSVGAEAPPTAAPLSTADGLKALCLVYKERKAKPRTERCHGLGERLQRGILQEESAQRS